MSVVLSIAAHGDPSQVSLALLYPEQCDDCWAPLYDWRPRQRFCAACVKAHHRPAQRIASRAYRERKRAHDAWCRAMLERIALHGWEGVA